MHRRARIRTLLASFLLAWIACFAQPAGAQVQFTADITGFVGYRYWGKVELDSLTIEIEPGVSYGFMADWDVERSGAMTIFIEFLFSEQRTQLTEQTLGESKNKVDDIRVRYFEGAAAVAWDWNRLRANAPKRFI